MPLRLYIARVRISFHEKRFRAHLQDRGYRLLQLSFHEGNPFRNYSDNYYVVTCATPENDIYRAHCRTSLYSNFFWTQPHHIGHLSATELERRYSVPLHKSTKEQLMDHLTSPYRHERRQDAQKIAQSETVDPVVVQLNEDFPVRPGRQRARGGNGSGQQSSILPLTRPI
ncbi:MAG: hypothetical protein H6650_01725 [Ardenticatenales bacterium]|nr:hypothetical protein [Ardenticatenales bacterium]